LTPGRPAVRAVLLDRDGTLVEDVPGNIDPDLVRLMPGAREAVGQLRTHGIRTAVVTNQPAVARGLVRWGDLARVHARIEELLGPLDAWTVCPHDRDTRCHCRKPAPGLILEAAGRLGVRPGECAVIGDVGSDMAAARAADAFGVLVPTARTRRPEIHAAPLVAPDLPAAVTAVLGRYR
jgi:D-glycero-D-manno-heptose 1,7-bisphosphate phosphatase